MTVGETSRFKVKPDDFPPDRSLKEDAGWHRMDVRWLVTGSNLGSKMTVVGHTTMPPGVKSKHALHRHPNAEEWLFILRGAGINHIGSESFFIRTGDVAFIPRNAAHGLENASETEALVVLWGYCGASSLEEAGYVIQDGGAHAT